MKKIISLMLMVAMLFSVVAFAEDEEFTLHNGTKFGMGLSEVYKMEKEHGIILTKQEDGRCLYTDTKIANQDDTHMTYYFRNGSLYQLRYVFTDADSYVGIENGLLNKYGETSYSSLTGTAFPAIKDVFTPFESYSTGDGSTCVGQHDRENYTHRLIQISDTDYVFIEHYTINHTYKYPARPKSNYNSYEHCLRYTVVDATTAQLIFDSIEKGNDDL